MGVAFVYFACVEVVGAGVFAGGLESCLAEEAVLEAEGYGPKGVAFVFAVDPVAVVVGPSLVSVEVVGEEYVAFGFECGPEFGVYLVACSDESCGESCDLHAFVVEEPFLGEVGVGGVGEYGFVVVGFGGFFGAGVGEYAGAEGEVGVDSSVVAVALNEVEECDFGEGVGVEEGGFEDDVSFLSAFGLSSFEFGSPG